MRVERDQDVEGNREPLEAEEQRHQVPRRDEEGHAATRGGEEGVVLPDVVAATIAPGDEHGGEAEPGDQDLGQGCEAVTRHRLGDQQLLLG